MTVFVVPTDTDGGKTSVDFLLGFREKEVGGGNQDFKTFTVTEERLL